jgi:hypothetical protein
LEVPKLNETGCCAAGVVEEPNCMAGAGAVGAELNGLLLPFCPKPVLAGAGVVALWPPNGGFEEGTVDVLTAGVNPAPKVKTDWPVEGAGAAGADPNCVADLVSPEAAGAALNEVDISAAAGPGVEANENAGGADGVAAEDEGPPNDGAEVASEVSLSPPS